MCSPHATQKALQNTIYGKGHIYTCIRHARWNNTFPVGWELYSWLNTIPHKASMYYTKYVHKLDSSCPCDNVYNTYTCTDGLAVKIAIPYMAMVSLSLSLSHTHTCIRDATMNRAFVVGLCSGELQTFFEPLPCTSSNGVSTRNMTS